MTKIESTKSHQSPNDPNHNRATRYLKTKALEKLASRAQHHKLRTLKTQHQHTSAQWWQEWCEEQAKIYQRKLLTTQDIPCPLNFDTNDYLGLERSQVLQSLHATLAHMLPLGGLSSRLVGGNHVIFDALEQTFANMLGFEAALYFSSGTALGNALPQLLKSLEHHPNKMNEMNMFSDKLNHACIIEGIRYAKIAKENLHIFAHLQMPALSNRHSKNHTSECNIVFCESLYSMDGDSPSMEYLKAIQNHQHTVLVMDEAHSIGVMGKGGKGMLHTLCYELTSSQNTQGTMPENLIGMYPCGKALGLSGALLAGPKWFIDYAINYASSFIYSTAPSPLIAASLLTRLYVLPHLSSLRSSLRELSHHISHSLSKLGYKVIGGGSPILAVIMENDHATLQLSAFLAKYGITSTAIRSPTVPSHSPRIRLSLHPFIKKEHQQILKKAFAAARKTLSQQHSSP